MLRFMHIIIISGLSGSGKSIALNLLEDAAYFCVDNLPPLLLQPLISQLAEQAYDKVAVAIDIRGGANIETLPAQLAALRADALNLQFIFLAANTETLLNRYAETRRRHPLVNDKRSLSEAIREERKRLASVTDLGHYMDTSGLKPSTLREWLRQLIRADARQSLTLVFESFGFKHGAPLDAELVFDVRCLPNPFYDPLLRNLTGRDLKVIEFLAAEPDVQRMRSDIASFVTNWLPAYIRDNRSSLTVGIGCTGGQHRSVYLAEHLAKDLAPTLAEFARVLVRHRELS